jgi:hypothetical protein
LVFAAGTPLRITRSVIPLLHVVRSTKTGQLKVLNPSPLHTTVAPPGTASRQPRFGQK